MTQSSASAAVTHGKFHWGVNMFTAPKSARRQSREKGSRSDWPDTQAGKRTGAERGGGVGARVQTWRRQCRGAALASKDCAQATLAIEKRIEKLGLGLTRHGA
jgi:hypothetical protein